MIDIAAQATTLAFITPVASGISNFGLRPPAFFDCLADAAFNPTVYPVADGRGHYEESGAFMQALGMMRLRNPRLIEVQRPLSRDAIGELQRRFPCASIVANMDKPLQIGRWVDVLSTASAAIVPHRSFTASMLRNASMADMVTRLKRMMWAGAMHCVSPGIDLDEFNPSKCPGIYNYGSRYGRDGPGRKQGNYDDLRRVMGLLPDAGALNIAYVGTCSEGDVRIARGILGPAASSNSDAYFFIVRDRDEPEHTRSIGRDKKRRRRTIRYIENPSPDDMHLLLAGSAIAVFPPEADSYNFMSNSQLRWMLAFMRYGAMPVVPKDMCDRGVVEGCDMRGKDRDALWLYPRGFGFFYDPDAPDAESVRRAVGEARVHDGRRNIRQDVYSAAIPNAMRAARRFGVQRETDESAAAYRSILHIEGGDSGESIARPDPPHSPILSKAAYRPVIGRIDEIKKSGKRPVVILDIDETILDARPRKLAVLRAYIEEKIHSKPDMALAQDRAADLKPEDLPYDTDGMIRVAGLSGRGLEDDYAGYFRRHFMSSRYLHLDTETPGAREFLLAIKGQGAEIVYLTGRIEETMREGTIGRFRDLSLPIDEDGVSLIMTSDDRERESEYKTRLMAQAIGNGVLAAFFENEPANINAIARIYPDAIYYLVGDRHKPNAPQVFGGTIHVPDFSGEID